MSDYDYSDDYGGEEYTEEFVDDGGYVEAPAAPSAVQNMFAAPQTPEEFQEASRILQQAEGALQGSPGAQAAALHAVQVGTMLLDERLNAHAADLGGVILNPTEARATADSLYRAAVAAGQDPGEAREWAVRSAATKVTGQDTYQSVGERFERQMRGGFTSAPKR